ncbi:hypothetical protein V6Z11_D05G270400 [Gossypium hirsutum]
MLLLQCDSLVMGQMFYILARKLLLMDCIPVEPDSPYMHIMSGGFFFFINLYRYVY